MSDITFPKLEPSDIEVRVSRITDKGCALLLYKDARCDMRILDSAVGANNWQCEYRRLGSDLYCRVGIRDDDGVFIWKEDVGVPSNMESTKGEASDAFKRACFKWGVGRELYTAPHIWVDKDHCRITRNNQGKPACYDRFSVTDIEYDDGGLIESVVIRNDTEGKNVYPRGGAPSKRTKYLNRIEELQNTAVSIGIKAEAMGEYVHSKFGKSLADLSEPELEDVGQHMAQLIRDKQSLRADGA